MLTLSLVSESQTHWASMFGEEKKCICLIIKWTSCKLSFIFPTENIFLDFKQTLKDILGMVRCHLTIFIDRSTFLISSSTLSYTQALFLEVRLYTITKCDPAVPVSSTQTTWPSQMHAPLPSISPNSRQPSRPAWLKFHHFYEDFNNHPLLGL